MSGHDVSFRQDRHTSGCLQDSTLQTQQCSKLKPPISLRTHLPLEIDFHWWYDTNLFPIPGPDFTSDMESSLLHFNGCIRLHPHLSSPRWDRGLPVILYPESHLFLNRLHLKLNMTIALHYFSPSASPHRIQPEAKFLQAAFRLNSHG